jgi:ribosomal protein L27
MARKGGISSQFYRETRGLKTSGGQRVKAGTVLTRQGNHWKSGINVIGQMHLTAGCDGEVYFTRKRGGYNKSVTFINVRPLKAAKKSS